MAKFRDSAPSSDYEEARVAHDSETIGANGRDVERQIGAILSELRHLSADQVQRVLEHQRQHGGRFGEAAVALGLASQDDVLSALSQQFNYAYVPAEQRAYGPELVSLNDPFSPRAETFRALRAQLMMRLAVEGEPKRAIAVVSPDGGDGKTYCAANLAVALAQLEGRTLLVDADMRSPRLQELFAIDRPGGLSGLLSGRADKGVVRQVRGVPSLFVLPVGTIPPNPLELVERPAFGMLMRELLAKFDHVVVDTPSASSGADAMVIAARCGAALLVARKNRSRQRALQDLVAGVMGGNARVAGVVVNEN